MRAWLFIALLVIIVTAADLISAQRMHNNKTAEERRDSLVTVHLSTTLTFAALGSTICTWQDGTSEMTEPGRVVASVPELGTELRAALESELADSLLEGLQDASSLGGGAAAAQGAAVTSITEGQMDGHWPPVHYAFVDVSIEIGVYAQASCLKAGQLRRAAESCRASVHAVADGMDAASASLAVALSDLDICFTESCEDEYSSAEPRAGDFEVAVERQTLPAQVLRAAAGKRQRDVFGSHEV